MTDTKVRHVISVSVRRAGQSVTEPVQKTKKVGGGKRVRWTNKAKRRALAELRPTGIAMLDLCMLKGRFPSRKALFCTERLKRDVAVMFQLDLLAIEPASLDACASAYGLCE